MIITMDKISISKKWSYATVKEQWQNTIILGERRKIGRVRAEPSDPKRTKGYLDAGYP